LHDFAGGFEEPQGLPPSRQNHAITLKEGASIPNLRPYRYPHYQKTEIEKLVGQYAGIIRLSILKSCHFGAKEGWKLVILH